MVACEGAKEEKRRPTLLGLGKWAGSSRWDCWGFADSIKQGIGWSGPKENGMQSLMLSCPPKKAKVPMGTYMVHEGGCVICA